MHQANTSDIQMDQVESFTNKSPQIDLHSALHFLLVFKSKNIASSKSRSTAFVTTQSDEGKK